MYFHSSPGDENFGAGELCRITHAGHYSWLIALKTVTLTVSRTRVTTRVTVAAASQEIRKESRREERKKRKERRGKRGHIWVR